MRKQDNLGKHTVSRRPSAQVVKWEGGPAVAVISTLLTEAVSVLRSALDIQKHRIMVGDMPFPARLDGDILCGDALGEAVQ